MRDKSRTWPFVEYFFPLSGTENGEAGLTTALLVAQIWKAHVKAVYIRVDSHTLAALAGESLSDGTISEMMALAEQERGGRLRALQTMFDRLTLEWNVAVSSTVRDAATASFMVLPGGEPDQAAQVGRLADLIVVPHPNAVEDMSSSNTLHALLFDAGRPVLIAPHQAPKRIGERIYVGWNGTSESAVAIWFALPWLQRAKSVGLLWAKEYQHRGPPAQERSEYLADRGVQAETVGFRPVGGDVGAGLLAATHEFGADLLAMGAYSHSRLRQLILGGVTRHVLEHAALPVLMSR